MITMTAKRLYGLLALMGMLRAVEIGESCKVFKTLSNVDWTKLENIEWIEIISSPDPEPYCVIREYFPANEWTRKTRKEGIDGNVVSKRRYYFSFQGGKQLLDQKGSSFEQILGTDYSTWIFVHICSGGKSRLALLTREPWSVVPEDIKERMDAAYISSGMANLRWLELPCYSKRGRN